MAQKQHAGGGQVSDLDAQLERAGKLVMGRLQEHPPDQTKSGQGQEQAKFAGLGEPADAASQAKQGHTARDDQARQGWPFSKNQSGCQPISPAASAADRDVQAVTNASQRDIIRWWTGAMKWAKIMTVMPMNSTRAGRR